MSPKRFGFLFLVLLSTFLASNAFAKSYSLEQAVVEVRIQPDGSVLATETITFDFKGSFSFAYRDFELSGVTLHDLRVFEGDQEFLESRSGEPGTFEFDGKRVTWYYSARDEQRTFSLHYRLKGAVTAYADVAEFYWKVWGADWDHPLKKIEAAVFLPRPVENASDLRAWGHPRLEGATIQRLANRVVFTALNVPAKQWVESRVVFPRALLASTTGANQENEAGLQKILDQEAAWAEQKESEEEFFWIGVLFLLLPIIAVLALFAACYWLYGREPRADYQGIYEREIPYDYPPALAGALVNFGVSASDFAATILDLVRRKHLKMRVVKTTKKRLMGLLGAKTVEDQEFSFTNKARKGLLDFEKDVLDLLEENAEKGVVRMKELQKEVRRSRKYSSFFKDWQDIVNAEAEARQLVDYTGKDKFKVYGVVVMAFFAFASIFFWLEFIGVMLAAVVYLVLLTASKGALPRRTREGALHAAKWLALKRFLGDFSTLKDKPPSAVILWEKYLVYGTSLGVSKTVAKAMDLKFSATERRHSSLYMGPHYGFMYIASARFTNSIGKNMVTSMSPQASGYGGGFAGGGGFGGGGGGGGAG